MFNARVSEMKASVPFANLGPLVPKAPKPSEAGRSSTLCNGSSDLGLARWRWLAASSCLQKAPLDVGPRTNVPPRCSRSRALR